MKIHLIVAHANPKSYNYVLFNAAKDTLTVAGHELEITELYPDFEQLNHFFGLNIPEAQQTFVESEQTKIKNTELTIVQFPMYWFSFPAILKQYFDIVFTKGFAYPGIYEKSPLYDGRQVLMSITTHSEAKDFTDAGRNGDISHILYPLEVAFRFVGYKILPTIMHYGVHDKDVAELSEEIERYRSLLLQYTNS